MSNPTPNRLRLDELIPALQELNRSQQLFLARYISNGTVTGTYDAEEACRLAYPKCTSDKAIQVRACQLLAKPTIRRVLDLHFRRSEAESLLIEVRRLLKRALRRNADRPKLLNAIRKLSKHFDFVKGL